MTDQEIARLRDLVGKATPGPWTSERQDEEDGSIYHAIHSRLGYAFVTNVEDDANAAYIVAACNAMPALLTELERTRAELDARTKAEGAAWDRRLEAVEARAALDTAKGLLRDARKKLAIYRKQTKGEYAGGPEYADLTGRIDAFLNNRSGQTETKPELEPCKICRRRVASPCNDHEGYRTAGPWDSLCRDWFEALTFRDGPALRQSANFASVGWDEETKNRVAAEAALASARQETEREIVAWLRGPVANYNPNISVFDACRLADAVERGEHRPTPTDPEGGRT